MLCVYVCVGEAGERGQEMLGARGDSGFEGQWVQWFGRGRGDIRWYCARKGGWISLRG